MNYSEKKHKFYIQDVTPRITSNYIWKVCIESSRKSDSIMNISKMEALPDILDIGNYLLIGNGTLYILLLYLSRFLIILVYFVKNIQYKMKETKRYIRFFP